MTCTCKPADVTQQCDVPLQAEADLAIERDSAESGASFSTDVGEAGKQIERSSKSLSALKPVRPPPIWMTCTHALPRAHRD